VKHLKQGLLWERFQHQAIPLVPKDRLVAEQLKAAGNAHRLVATVSEKSDLAFKHRISLFPQNGLC
jgi:hypothetical protein